MRIIIEKPANGAEDEIIIRCAELDDELLGLIKAISSNREQLVGYDGKSACKLEPKDIYYFESVDGKLFACCEKKVYEVKCKLYEAEERFSASDFVRISKSVLANVSYIERVTPSFGARLEAMLTNGEKLIISRQYVPEIKKKLGMEV